MTARDPSDIAGPGHRGSAWEATSDTAPPPEVMAVLKPGEKPLWAATISSKVNAGALFWFGALCLIIVGVVAYLAPWGQSLDAFCPPGEKPSCRKGYFTIFFCVFVMGPSSLGLLWFAWQAKYRSWNWHCAVTNTRALLIDGRDPKISKSIDLSRDPPRIDYWGRLAFGRKPIRLGVFGTLKPHEVQRVLYWADKARNATAMDKTE
jgi:hypothetical protein